MTDLDGESITYPTKILATNVEKLNLTPCLGLWDLDGNKRGGCGTFSDVPDCCAGSRNSGHIRTNLYKVKGKWFSVRAAYREALLSITEVDDAITGNIFRPQLMYITCWSELVSELKLVGITDEAFLKVIPLKTFNRIKGNVLKKLLNHNHHG